MMGKREQIEIRTGDTDYIAVNAPSVAKMMRGGRYYRREGEFRSTVASLGNFWRLIGFMGRSVLWRIPGKKTERDVIKFAEPSDVTIHAEGEIERLKGVKKIEVKKAERPLRVIKF